MTSTVPSRIPYLESLGRLIRYRCVMATSAADSGHLTSSLSAADLMTALRFGNTFRFMVDDPASQQRPVDLLQGRVSPLFYVLWAAAGAIDAGVGVLSSASVWRRTAYGAALTRIAAAFSDLSVSTAR